MTIRVLFFILIFSTTATAQDEFSSYPYYKFSADQLNNKHDKYSIPKQILDTMRFADGLAAIKVDAKTGFTNAKGMLIVYPKYDTIICLWKNGVAIMGIRTEAGLTEGAINQQGVEVIPFRFLTIKQEQDEVWSAKKTDGILSLYLSSGMVLADSIDNFNVNSSGYIIIQKKCRWGVKSKKGEVLIPITYKYIQEEFPDEFLATPFPKWQMKDIKNTTLATFDCDSLVPVAHQLYRFELNKKSGLITMDKKQLLAPVYDQIDTIANLLLLKNEGRLGLAEHTGQLLLPVAYDSILVDKSGYIRGKLGGNWGLYDIKGKELLPPVFANLKLPSQNIIPVKGKQGLWGYVSLSGDTVLPFRYTYAGNFKNDSASVGIKGQLVAINRSGIVVVPPQFYAQYYFGMYKMEDTANCYVYPPYFHYKYADAGDGYILVKQGKDKGVVNKAGKVIVPIDYDSIFAPSVDTVFLVTKDFKIGTYDKYGNVLSTPNEKLQQVFPLHCNRARMLKKDRYGYIDKMGNVRISPQYVNAMDYSENRAAVVITGRWGFIDEEENIKAQPYYSDVYSFIHGAARVKLDGKWNFVNKSGKEVNSSWYEEIKPTPYDNWYLYNKKRMGVADTSGQEIIVPRYEHIEDLGNGYYEVNREGRIGVLNSKADFIIPFEYDDAHYDPINHLFLMVTKGKEELIKIGAVKKK